jgi:hypothetical protein
VGAVGSFQLDIKYVKMCKNMLLLSMNDYIHISIMGKAIHFLQSGFVPKT